MNLILKCLWTLAWPVFCSSMVSQPHAMRRSGNFFADLDDRRLKNPLAKRNRYVLWESGTVALTLWCSLYFNFSISKWEQHCSSGRNPKEEWFCRCFRVNVTLEKTFFFLFCFGLGWVFLLLLVLCFLWGFGGLLVCFGVFLFVCLIWSFGCVLGFFGCILVSWLVK